MTRLFQPLQLLPLLPLLPLLLAMLAGCASPPPAAPPPSLFLDAAFAPPSETIGAADLFTLSPAMQAYLRSPVFTALLRTRGRQRGLLDALYRQQDLKLDSAAGRTRLPRRARTRSGQPGRHADLWPLLARLGHLDEAQALAQRVAGIRPPTL